MISPRFIKKQIEKSFAQRQTSSFLRRLLFSALDHAARQHYGNHYPMKCVQCAAVTTTVLRSWGIKCNASVGAMCIAEVFADPNHFQWGGFWDRDHHAWTVTEFNELIDLPLSLLHRHPASNRQDGLAPPALWWNDAGTWPWFLRYLPDSRLNPSAMGNSADTADLRTFRALVEKTLQDKLADRDVSDIHFDRILNSIETLEEWDRAGDDWLRGLRRFPRQALSMPQWIVKRDQELIDSWRSGTAAPSRLPSDLVGPAQGAD